MLSRGSKIVSTTPQNVTGMLSKRVFSKPVAETKARKWSQKKFDSQTKIFPSKQEINCKKNTRVFQFMECLACLPNFSL